MDNKDKQIQEIQILEQSLQSLLMQKQAFQMELAETQSAIREIEKSGEQVFKVVGQLMIQTQKKDLQAELSEKEKMINSKLGSLEEQEENFSKKLEDTRKKVLGK